MPEITFLFSNPVYIDLPIGIWGWVTWLMFLCLVLYLTWKVRGLNINWTKERWIILGILIFITPITNLLIPGIQLQEIDGLPLPMIPRQTGNPVIMIFSAIPWMLAAGFHGPFAAVGLALFSGLFLSLWNIHNLFFPLEISLLSLIFSATLNQRYRTPFFRWIRQPTTSALLIIVAYPFIFLIDSMFATQGTLAVRIDYGFTNIGTNILSIGIPIVIGGLITQSMVYLTPLWSRKSALIPSPAEKSLEARFLYGITIVAIVLCISLIVGNWVVAGRVARQVLEQQIITNAKIAAESVPFLLESGQILIQKSAQEFRIATYKKDQIFTSLPETTRNVPYFSQLILIDKEGKCLASYPITEKEPSLTQDEKIGFELARSGVLLQYYVFPPINGSQSANLSFLSTIQGTDGKFEGVLIGRTDLNTNPFAQPLINSLRSMEKFNGEGILLDERGRILFHTDSNQIMEKYNGKIIQDEHFYEDLASDGTRRLVIYRQVVGRPWSVVLSLPAREVQNYALIIATPIAIMVFGSLLVSLFLLRVGLRVVTSSIKNLVAETDRIAQGNLDHSLKVDGVDEISLLSQSFDKMRRRLKSRLDELNRLLIVSQKVASTLDITEAMTSILESALIEGATSARVILFPIDPLAEFQYRPQKLRYGIGPSSDTYSALDDQILSLTDLQERVVISNLSRPRFLEFPEGIPHPQALIAMNLNHKGEKYGALWIAFDRPRTFSDEEIRFLTTLARQAAMSASNARLFHSAEIGRRRLESVLSSSPDPILVISNQNRSILANPAAAQVFSFHLEKSKGTPIEELISHEKLVNLLRSSLYDQQSEEIVMPDGRVFFTFVSVIRAEGRSTGRACIMRDVTHFKKIDELKTEFVATVSHDLRSPLQLIRGYASMIQMIGGLTDQQNGYIRQILSSVENMSKLVSNLLDLGRIEAGVGLQLEKVPIREIIERVYSDLQVEAAQKHIHFSLETPPLELPIIEVDRSLLQQALRNLVENAIKYTDSGGDVKLGLQVYPEEVVFEVIDNGIGISPADQPRLFEKFYRIQRRGTSGERGSGLGLAIVKSIAEKHKGRIWVESQLGKGSKFYLSIPIQQTKHHQNGLDEDKKLLPHDFEC